MSKKPYDWDRPIQKGSDDLLDIDYHDKLAQQWHAPIDVVERSFWRGVIIGATCEAVVFLLIFGIIWLL
jgi:hypothetical protein